MTDTPLIRAARALAKAQSGVDEWDALDGGFQATLIENVRAVGLAFRDVDSGSPAVLAAGKQALYSCSEDPELEDARKCWHAMWDTALSE